MPRPSASWRGNICLDVEHENGKTAITFLELLVAEGDNLERGIVQNHSAELLPIIDPYAEIWAKYVLPNRNATGESVTEPWLLFASSHYSALVRFQNAALFKMQIDQTCCEKCEGKQLLELQAYTAAFWWSLGAVVDNLGQAIEKFPGVDLSAIADDVNHAVQSSGKNYICGRVPSLGFLYDRRTQHIHSRVIPIGSIGDHPYFDKRYVDGTRRENLAKDTRWQEVYKDPHDLAKVYDERWQEALKEIMNAWCHIRCLFAEVAKKRLSQPKPTRALQFSLPVPTVTNMSSAFNPVPVISIEIGAPKRGHGPGESGWPKQPGEK